MFDDDDDALSYTLEMMTGAGDDLFNRGCPA